MFNLPAREEGVAEMLGSLPEGFIRDPTWGLGLQKNFKPIIDAIVDIRSAQSLILTDKRATGLDNSIFYLSYDDYEELRRAMNRIQSRYQKEALLDRQILAHNTILNVHDPATFPQKNRQYKPDTIFTILGGAKSSPLKLSKHDRAALVDRVSEQAPTIAEKEPERLIKLRSEIELVTLDRLIERFDEMLARATSENDWQKLFRLNPFILTMIFGYPIVLLAPQGHVGGTDISGRGEKITDFLVKNNKTHNVAIVEIKTPNTDLVLNATYREGVHKIAPDLTNSVLQILDQRHRFASNIATLKMNTRGIEMESYSIGCFVIAGRMPQEIAQQKALELYRGSFKEVNIITFDELRERLVTLRDYLTTTPPPIIDALDSTSVNAEVPF